MSSMGSIDDGTAKPEGDEKQDTFTLTLEPVLEETEVGYHLYKEAVEEGLAWDAEEEGAVRRKIDWHILPCFCITQGLAYLDKTALNYANLFGIKTYYPFVSQVQRGQPTVEMVVVGGQEGNLPPSHAKMSLKRPLRRSESSTTHVSDSEPERAAQRRRNDLSETARLAHLPTPAPRPPLAAIQNHLHRLPPVHKRCQGKISALEGRVQMLERELVELKQQITQSAYSTLESGPSHSMPTSPPPTGDGMPLERLLDHHESFQTMKASDPTLYVLPTPIRSVRKGVTRRLGHRTDA
ncbi:hypothetical protein GGX14DRAFT_573923 [Mycena pura]|uniref:Uncharacterized protein n=1 Tax=Mycena pura TaxID=153505 RepID=A0AAD6UXX0_9AGAR|nr:hypothetical protein GGX14DRAFT_573923 [Mycena pura]